MSVNVAQKFIQALRTLESSRDAEPLVALYTESARVGNVIAPKKFQGPAGARQFWSEYRGTFDQVQSEFLSVIVGDGGAALEWTTEGTSTEGQTFYYAGVTLLETEGDQVIRSTAYFDPAALGRQIEG